MTDDCTPTFNATIEPLPKPEESCCPVRGDATVIVGAFLTGIVVATLFGFVFSGAPVDD